MKNLIISIVFIFLQKISFALTEKGIQFENKMTWEQVLAKAQKENKYIFVDCYTTWCSPCKMLDKGAFASEKAKAYFAENLISYKLQMDKTDKDSDEIKNTYDSADYFATTFGINSYPTLMLFNPKGEFVHRIAGLGYLTDIELIEQVKLGFSPETRSFNLKKRYDNGDRTPELLKIYAQYLISFDMMNSLSEKVSLEYLQTQSNWSAEKNKLFVFYCISMPKSKTLKYVKYHQKDFEEYFTNNWNVSVKEAITQATQNECLNDAINPETKKIDIQKFESNLRKKFSKVVTDKIVLEFNINQATQQKKFDEHYVNWVEIYLNKVKDNKKFVLNEYAWKFYENIENKEYLKKALVWALESVKLDPKSYNNGTVAHLLFKIGEDMALAKEYAEKAIETAEKTSGDTADIKNLLEKINKRLAK